MTSGEGRAAVRRRRIQQSRGRDVAGIALLGGSLVVSALLFGAQQTSVLLVATLLAAGAALLIGSSTTPRLVWLLLFLAGYTLLQILPLPLGLVTRLSPASAAVWQGALRPFGSPPPAWVTLSVDPAATALEALKWFGYACVFVAASGLRARRGPVWIAMLVIGSSFAVCVVTLTHGILDIQHVYGIYASPDASQWLRGPFVNGNNLAGYLNVGLFAGVGLLLAGQTKVPSWPFALAVPLLAVQIILTGSRGGVGALVIMALLLAVVTVRQRRVVPPRALALGSAGAVVALAAALALGGPLVLRGFADRDLHAKVSAWRWTLGMIEDFPVFGVGRGAFETAFQPYRQLLGNNWTMVFPYAENFVLQWVADWGPGVAIAALAAWAYLARAGFARALRDPLAAGLAAGVLALLLQNLVDLGLELFAVSALGLVALAGIVESAPARRSWLPSGVLPAVGVAISAIIVVATGATLVRIERQRIAKEYTAWARAGAKNPRGFLADIRKSILRHPGEAYFPLIGSVPMERAGGDPLRFIGRALERSPLDGQAHLRLADVMAARKATQQALFHLRLSALYDGILRDHALRKAANLAPSADDLARAFPKDVPGGSLLAEVCQRALGPVRVGCWEEVVRRDGRDAVSKRELVAALLDALEAPAPPCVGDASARCSLDVARLLREVEAVSNEWRVKELRARELAARGDNRRAVELLLEHCPNGNDAVTCSERAVDIAGRSKDLPLLGKAAARYLAVTCGDAVHCARVHERLGRIYTEQGAFGHALKHYSTAANEDPSADRWLQSAEAAARAGSTLSARFAFERARNEGQLNTEQEKRVQAVEAMLADFDVPR